MQHFPADLYVNVALCCDSGARKSTLTKVKQVLYVVGYM